MEQGPAEDDAPAEAEAVEVEPVAVETVEVALAISADQTRSNSRFTKFFQYVNGGPT